MSTPLAPRPLYGGAITLPVPVDYMDVSDLRQVPDNQEVFVSPLSDTSLIVEVLGLVEDGQAGSDLWEAAKFHFTSLAHDNASLSTTLLTPAPGVPLLSRPAPSPSGTPAPTVLAGLQHVHKFSHDASGAPRPGREADAPDAVWVAVAVWRCWVDGAPGTRKRADVVCSVNVRLGGGDEEKERDRVEAWWTEAVRGLRIEDWGLFADE
ncbi:hypothetical protein Q5752_000221 [Cryptotrichosporon argae]